MNIEPYIASNLVTIALLVAIVFLVTLIRRERLWREAAVALWSRRKVAIVVVGIYDATRIAARVARNMVTLM